MVRQEAVLLMSLTATFSWLSSTSILLLDLSSKTLQFQTAPMKSILKFLMQPLHCVHDKSIFILLTDSYQNSLSLSLLRFVVTSLRSQQSVVSSIITAGWEFFEGTEWWKDLTLDWMNSRSAFQPLLRGLTARLDQISVVSDVEFSNVECSFASMCFLPRNIHAGDLSFLPTMSFNMEPFQSNYKCFFHTKCYCANTVSITNILNSKSDF